MQRRRNTKQRKSREERSREKIKNILLPVSGLVILLVALFTLTSLAPDKAPVRKLPPRNESFSDGRYLNREWGIDFTYPKEWGTLVLDEYEGSTNPYDLNRETIHMKAMNPRVAQISFHVPSKTIVFIEREGTEEERPYGKELFKLLEDGSTQHVYALPQSYADWGGRGVFSYVYFSPSGRYAVIEVITSIETSVTKVFDLETGRDLFGGVCLNDDRDNLIDCLPGQGPHGLGEDSRPTLEEFIGFRTLIHWSDDEQILVLESYPNYIGGDGLDGLFISDYGEPGKINIAFTRDKASPPLLNDVDQCGLCPLTIDEIEIHKEGMVTFNATIAGGFGDEADTLEKRRFEYNTKTRELKELVQE